MSNFISIKCEDTESDNDFERSQGGGGRGAEGVDHQLFSPIYGGFLNI